MLGADAASDTFTKFGLSEGLLQAIRETGYTTPTPIQEKAIPAILSGSDVMGAAQTGTGKTAAFTLPLIEKLALSKTGNIKPKQATILILTPTRELAAQVQESIDCYSKHTSVVSTVVYGGVNINPQIKRLARGVDIVVATPGRLLDLYRQKAIRFDALMALVLDEADRMLDMGFIHDIRKIVSKLPKQRQTLLFSATFSDEIRKLAKTVTQNPTEIAVAAKNSAAESIEQSVYLVGRHQKIDLLLHLLKEHQWYQVLVFTRTKHKADKLAGFLRKNKVSVAAIHGNKRQGERTRALSGFKDGKTQVLVATDIAARGLDINQLPQVVNFELPHVPEDYIHRIGRTGRAGEPGNAISLVEPEERKQLKGIERLLKTEIERKTAKGFRLKEPILDRSRSLRSTPRKVSSRQRTSINSSKPKFDKFSK